MVLIIIGIIGVVFFVGLVVVYWYEFGLFAETYHPTWGVIGDFSGGLINPILSFLAFVALLITIAVQARELHISNETLKQTRVELENASKIASRQAQHISNDSTKNELHRALSLVDSDLREVFEKKADFSVHGMNIGYYFSFSAPSASEDAIPRNGERVSDSDRVSIADLCELVSIMNMLLSHLDTLGPSAISYYYKVRYSTCARRLQAKEFMIDSPWDLNAFGNASYYFSGPLTGRAS